MNKGFNTEYAEEPLSIDELKALADTVVLEFGAPWCGHCQAAQAAIKQGINQHANLRHIKIYDGKGKRLGRRFKVTLWPTLILLHQGNEVARLVRPLTVHQVEQFLTILKDNP